jgi:hypothetical protein
MLGTGAISHRGAAIVALAAVVAAVLFLFLFGRKAE